MKILFIGNTRLGDAIISTCILQLYNKKGNDITVVCGPIATSIYSNFKYVNKVISIKKKRYSKHWIELYYQLKSNRWDVIIDLRNTLISRLVRKNTIYRLSNKNEQLHKVVHLSQLMKIRKKISPKLYVSKKFKEEAAFFIKKNGINNKTIAISPVTNWRRKNWPIKYFALLLESLFNEKSVSISKAIILGDKNDKNYCEQLKKITNCKNVINLAGLPSVLAIHEIVKKCVLFVGNDSGLSHLSAASGTNTLSLFGPSKEKVYKPWGKNGFFIRTPKTYEELVNVKGYNRFDNNSLMEELSVEDVKKKCIKILKNQH